MSETSLAGRVDSITDSATKNVEELTGATKEFVESNNLVTKFVFILGVLLLFLYGMRMLISLLGWFFMASPTPYISKGLTNPDTSYQFEVNPNIRGSVPILRSNNARTGVEFTYSVWLFVDGLKGNGTSSNKYNPIFNKGDIDYKDSNGLSRSAAPGLYISESDNKLKIRMNVFHKDPLGTGGGHCAKSSTYGGATGTDTCAPITNATDCDYQSWCEWRTGNITSSEIYDDITITDIPLKKWFNVMIRCEGNMVDVFINGMVVKRHKLSGIPRQNYNKVYLTPNNPFKGFVSDLRYWNYSMGTNEIYNLISRGPNTKNLKAEQSLDGTVPRYFSTSWFLKN